MPSPFVSHLTELGSRRCFFSFSFLVKRTLFLLQQIFDDIWQANDVGDGLSAELSRYKMDSDVNMPPLRRIISSESTILDVLPVFSSPSEPQHNCLHTFVHAE